MARSLRVARRAGATVLGGLVLLIGLAMLVLPGPGLLVAAAGLAILATEYDWAHRHVERVRRRAHQVSILAGANRRNTVLAVLSGVGLVAAGVVLVLAPALLPVGGGLAAGVGLCVGGVFMLVGTALGRRERRVALQRAADAAAREQGSRELTTA